jgi:hypothetical protein
MRSFPMPLIALSATLLLSACAEQKSEEAAATDQSASAEGAGPAISGAVAPGVAFRYDYAFTLPGKSISQVQQQHAAACQNLGPSRCRVTGIAYDQPGEDQVSARLDLLLAPDLAHRFANEGIATVERAEGKLDNAHVTGENAGDAIKLSQADSAANDAEIARIEARLAAKGLTNAERVELRQQIANLREQQRGQAQDRKVKEASIASTPVVFGYTSEGILSGKGTFAKAAGASWSSVQGLLSFLTLLLGIALPWLLLVGGVVAVWRSAALSRLLKRLFGTQTPQASLSE